MSLLKQADKTLGYATKPHNSAIISKPSSDYNNPKSFLRILLLHLPKSKIKLLYINRPIKVNQSKMLPFNAL